MNDGRSSTDIWACQPFDGGIRTLQSGEGMGHFPYVCFSGDVSALAVRVDPSELGSVTDRRLQPLVAETIHRLQQEGRLKSAPIYGLRLEIDWRSLVITVASKLCMGQFRRNRTLARSASGEDSASRTIYDQLQHFRLAPEAPADPSDPIRYLGASLSWNCCGFYDSEPSTGRVTVPDERAHLHHEHWGTSLQGLRRFVVYPLQRLHHLVSDLSVEEVRLETACLHFTVVNRGTLDVSDVAVAVVVDDRYSSHRYLRLPWLAAGARDTFAVPLDLAPGLHRLEVIADPEAEVIESPPLQANNRVELLVQR